MFKLIQFCALLPLIWLAAPAQAAFSPLEVAIISPVQFPAEDYTITGARLSLVLGKQRVVYGVDIGVLGNITELEFVGIGISGLFNLTEGTTTAVGAQLAGLANINTNHTRIFGLQATLGVNYNAAEAVVYGLQIAPLANISPFTKICGVQAGIYNRANDVYGFQIGIVNVAKSLHGVQVGLLNFNQTGLFYVAPVINVGF